MAATAAGEGAGVVAASEGHPKYIDTHTHLDLTMSKLKRKLAYEELRDGTIREMARGLGAEYEGCVHVSCSLTTLGEATELAAAAEAEEQRERQAGAASYDSGLRMALGVHPHEASTYTEEGEAQLVAAIERLGPGRRVVAVGECGLDYHYMNSTREQQLHAFRRQVLLSVNTFRLPLVVHTREADEDTLAILRELLPPDWPVHIHCFTGSPAFATQLLALSNRLCIGITGVVTFNSATEVQEAVKVIPLDRLLLETDAPYMSPVPLRGKTCHSGMIPYVARKIAALKSVTVEETFQQIRQNTRLLYSF